jgi:alkanesulfonate monooxygenase SsuD/methylene tetrahydromethanopterin reductase-like flavin-dependent oxidoreductase (luciferase family)
MRVGIVIGFLPQPLSADLELAAKADALGLDSVWVAEAGGRDAGAIAAAVAARSTRIRVGTGIMQMFPRTPTLAAMTAVTIQNVSGGRFVLGLGVGTRANMAAWHGLTDPTPTSRVQEYVTVVQQLLANQVPNYTERRWYQTPGLASAGGVAARAFQCEWSTPIYLGAIGEMSCRMAAEQLDGWLSLWGSPEQVAKEISTVVQPGLQMRERSVGSGFEVGVIMPVIVADDVAFCLESISRKLAAYIAAPPPNSYFDRLVRAGYRAEAEAVRDAYQRNDRAGAGRLIPIDFVDEVSLVGPPDRIRRKARLWAEAGISLLIAASIQAEALEILAGLEA